MNSQIKKFLNKKDEILHKGKLGLLCNQTSFDLESGEYLFESLAKRGNLKRIFIPEHGLFAELQDQIPLDSTDIYRFLNLDVEFISLYKKSESSLIVSPDYLTDLEALVVDIQDVGSRYYTYVTTLSYIFDVLAQINSKIFIYVIDHLNPSGRSVEGTILTEEYASFVGRPGLPHRHGLTIGELCRYYKEKIGGKFSLKIIKLSPDAFSGARDNSWRIPPSPNMPGPITPLVYPGQCLLEGTNISEGRGTTRPFEIFGAPYMNWIHQNLKHPAAIDAVLRPLKFVPTFHKYSGEICDGFQIIVTGGKYHSLGHSLKIIRYIKEHSNSSFQWRDETYEFRSDRRAIELLAGDKILIDYLEGRCPFLAVRQAFEETEGNWISGAKNYLIYPEPLYRNKLLPRHDYA